MAFSKREENTVGKGEIACNKQFLPFPQSFQKTCTADTLKLGFVWERVNRNVYKTGSANAMVLGCGYQTTHLLPVLGGRLNLANCRRINIGGAHIDGFMQRLLQLKYPGHVNSITLNRAEVRHIIETLYNAILSIMTWWKILFESTVGNSILMSECNTVLSAYTLYRHLV